MFIYVFCQDFKYCLWNIFFLINVLLDKQKANNSNLNVLLESEKINKLPVWTVKSENVPKVTNLCATTQWFHVQKRKYAKTSYILWSENNSGSLCKFHCVGFKTIIKHTFLLIQKLVSYFSDTICESSRFEKSAVRNLYTISLNIILSNNG